MYSIRRQWILMKIRLRAYYTIAKMYLMGLPREAEAQYYQYYCSQVQQLLDILERRNKS